MFERVFYFLRKSFCIASVPDSAGGRGQRRAERPDVLLVLLHGGNGDLEGGDVGQQHPRGKRGLLPLFVLLRLQQRHKLDLDDGAGKTKHTPRESREERRWRRGGGGGGGEEVEVVEEEKEEDQGKDKHY